MLIIKENEKLSRGNSKVKEIFVTEPTRLNTELNNEVNYARDIMSKISKLMNAEKRKNEKLEKINSEKTSEINLLNKKMLEIIELNNENDKKNKGNNDNDNDTEKNNENFNKNDKIILETNYNNKSKGKFIFIISWIFFYFLDSLSDISSELDSLSNYSDSQKSENSIDVNFPEKVKMNEKHNHHKSVSLIPKLDFTKVNEKYNNDNNNLKKINLNQNKISIKNLKREENETDSKKLKRENEKNIEKIKKYKESYNKLKEKYKKLKSILKISNGRIEILEMQIKRIPGSTEDITNKRSDQIENNTSMVNFYFLLFFI